MKDENKAVFASVKHRPRGLWIVSIRKATEGDRYTVRLLNKSVYRVD